MAMTFSKPIKQFNITLMHCIILAALAVIIISTYASYTFLTKLPKADESDISTLVPHNDLIVQVIILTSPTTINGTTRFIANVESIKDQMVSGKVQVSLRGMLNARRGDQVTVTGDLQRARPNDTFLRNRQVFSQLFASKITKGDKTIFTP